jgi:hypothetical protein
MSAKEVKWVEEIARGCKKDSQAPPGYDCWLPVALVAAVV